MNIGLLRKALFFISIAAFVSGCGYTTHSAVYEGAKSIYVQSFENKIELTKEVTDKRMYIGYRSGMELQITRLIIDKFVTDGYLRITDQNGADLILSGVLKDFRKEALRFDSGDNITQYRVKVIVDFTLYSTKNKANIFELKNFTGESTYTTTGAYSASEDQAITAATEDLASRVVERVVEGW